MIKSTKSTLRFANTNKLEKLNLFIDEYRCVVSQFVTKLWENDKISNLLPKEITSTVETWLSARAIQCAGKQASGIVRGCRKKQEKRKWMIGKLVETKQFKKARKLQRIYEEISISKPNISDVEPELDSRFVKINMENPTNFAGWITLSSLGNKLKIEIPFKKHRHFNKMLNLGNIKEGIRLSKKNITFMFEIVEPNPVLTGSILGIDIGQKTTLSCSNGQMIGKDSHNHDYSSICKALVRKKKGSKSFKKTEKHRTNYINWSVNQLNLVGVKQVNRENIVGLRKGRNTSRLMKHWNYAELFDKLDSKLCDAGVQINKVNPTYTSQRCSSCGWVRKGNRKKKEFKCDKCGFAADADLNASTNLSLSLLPIGKQQRLSKINKTGFYWLCSCQESIVPDAYETLSVENFEYKK